MGSSFLPTFDAISREYGVSTKVVTLTLSLYVLEFAFGPLVSILWKPNGHSFL
jgi:hypothetical protein